MSIRSPVVEGFHDLELIGRGGFSLVYKARQDHIDRLVAIKVFKDFDPTDLKARDRFLREGRAMGRLSGIPHIVDIFLTSFTDDGRPCIVMPLLGGGSLEEHLAARGPWNPTEVADLGATLAEAVAQAHRRGISHRDIKPANVLLDEDRQPWLGDFGIAAIEDVLTGTQTHRSLSPPHAPPERLLGVDDADDRAGDIYSLGSTLYTALAGAPPFGTSDEVGLVEFSRRVVEEAPPSQPLATVPPALREATLAMLAKQPTDRPSSADAVARLLRSSITSPALGQDAAPMVVAPASGATTISRRPKERIAAEAVLPTTPPRSNWTRWLVGGLVTVMLAIGVIVAVSALRPAQDSAATATTSTSGSTSTSTEAPSTTLDPVVLDGPLVTAWAEGAIAASAQSQIALMDYLASTVHPAGAITTREMICASGRDVFGTDEKAYEALAAYSIPIHISSGVQPDPSGTRRYVIGLTFDYSEEFGDDLEFAHVVEIINGKAVWVGGGPYYRADYAAEGCG